MSTLLYIASACVFFILWFEFHWTLLSIFLKGFICRTYSVVFVYVRVRLCTYVLTVKFAVHIGCDIYSRYWTFSKAAHISFEFVTWIRSFFLLTNKVATFHTYLSPDRVCSTLPRLWIHFWCVWSMTSKWTLRILIHVESSSCRVCFCIIVNHFYILKIPLMLHIFMKVAILL